MKCGGGGDASQVVGMGVAIKEINTIRRNGPVKWLTWQRHASLNLIIVGPHVVEGEN